MGRHQFCHAVEDDIVARHVTGIHGRAVTFLIVTAIDPAIVKSELVGGPVVVEHALSGMENFFLGDSEPRQIFDHIFEIVRRWFVGAYIFRRIYRIELHA